MNKANRQKSSTLIYWPKKHSCFGPKFGFQQGHQQKWYSMPSISLVNGVLINGLYIAFFYLINSIISDITLFASFDFVTRYKTMSD